MKDIIIEKKILLILKSKELSNTVSSLMRGRNITADTASLGFQAATLFEKNCYALIFTDFKFKDMYGTEILSLYQSWPGTSKKTKLMITGRPRQITSIRDEICENDWEFLTKPYNEMDLVEYLEKSVNSIMQNSKQTA